MYCFYSTVNDTFNKCNEINWKIGMELVNYKAGDYSFNSFSAYPDFSVNIS